MAWGTVTIAGIALRETRIAEQSTDALRITGQEAHPPSTRGAVLAAHQNINALELGAVVPVVFTDKAGLTGFYRVQSATSTLAKIQEGMHMTAVWGVALERVGGSRDVEIESRVPTVARTAAIGSPPAAVFWHAPAVGSNGYSTGATPPTSTIQRQSSDGAVPVYLGIPAGISPRWTVPAEAYLEGSAQVLLDGIRRVGRFTPDLAVWEVNNSLVRLMSGTSGSFTVSCWDSGDWRSPKSYAVLVNGVALTDQPEMTVLRNSPEEVAIRLTYASNPGRIQVDLSLRRGARFVTGIIKRSSSATLAVQRTAAEAASVVTGGLRATSADSDGNRFVMGSTAVVTTTTGTASLSKASVLSLDFFVGHEVDPSPQAGDAFADLWQQYRGSTGDRTRVVLR